MKILALITARGGSKRVPGKNVRPLGRRPLITWSIDVVKEVREICDILVTTDDPEIADIARNEEALVPWLRPSELATDSASSVDVALHAIDWYEGNKGKVDGLLLLQPTSPFRSRSSIERAIEIFCKSQFRPVIGVSPAKSHPMQCFKIEADQMSIFIQGGEALRSQDLPPAYEVNGAIFMIAPDDLRKERSFYTKNMLPLVIDAPEESIDIDTEWDWLIAEAVEANIR